MSKIEGFSRRCILAAGLLALLAAALGHIVVQVVLAENLDVGIVDKTALSSPGSWPTRNGVVKKATDKNKNLSHILDRIEHLLVHVVVSVHGKYHTIVWRNDVLKTLQRRIRELPKNCFESFLGRRGHTKNELPSGHSARAGPSVLYRDFALRFCADRQFADFGVKKGEPRTLFIAHVLKCLICNSSGFMGSVDCGLGESEASPHVDPLLSHGEPLEVSHGGKNAGKKHHQDRVDDAPPIGRRIILVFVAFVLMWPIGRLGILLIERGRTWLGRAAIGVAVGGLVGSEMLFVLTGFRWSWGWWW